MPKHHEFEMLVRTFHRKANTACKHMLDQWNRCKTLANTLAEQFDFDIFLWTFFMVIQLMMNLLIQLKLYVMLLVKNI